MNGAKPRADLWKYFAATLLGLILTVSYAATQPSLRWAGILITASAVAVVISVGLRVKGKVTVPLPAFVFGGLFLFDLAMSSQSPLPLIGLEKSSAALPLLIILTYVTNSTRGSWRPETWENALINLALVFSLVELLLAGVWLSSWWQVTNGSPPLPPVGYRLSGLFLGHANVMAGYLNLVLPIAIYRMLQSGQTAQKRLWQVGIAVFCLSLYFCSSRAGWISTLGGVLAMAWLLDLRKYSVTQNLRRFTRYASREPAQLGLRLLVSVTVLYLLLVQAQSSPGHAPIATSRTGIWRAAVSVIQDGGFFGSGPASFSMLFARETRIPPGFATSHAHNMWLQIAAESGVIGLALVLLAIGLILRGFVRIWRSADESQRPRLAAYAAAGSALLMHNQVDFLFESPGYQVTAIILLGLLYGMASRSERPRLSHRYALLAAGLITAIYLAANLVSSRGAVQYWNGVQAGRTGDWTSAASEICQAAETNPAISLYSFQCGIATAHAADRRSENPDLHAAISAFEQGTVLDDFWPLHWANLAQLEWHVGRRQAAMDHMWLALMLAPANPELALNLGWMAELLNQDEVASVAYKRALENSPGYSESAYFQQTELRSSLVEQQPVGLHESTHGWELIGRGDYRAAELVFQQVIEQHSAAVDGYLGLAAAHAHTGGYEEANRNLRIAEFLDPSDPRVRFERGQLELRRNRPGAAAEHFRGGFEILRSHSDSYSYYARTYSRFFLATDLVPQFVHADLTQQDLDGLKWLMQYASSVGESAFAEEIGDFLDRSS